MVGTYEVRCAPKFLLSGAVVGGDSSVIGGRECGMRLQDNLKPWRGVDRKTFVKMPPLCPRNNNHCSNCKGINHAKDVAQSSGLLNFSSHLRLSMSLLNTEFLNNAFPPNVTVCWQHFLQYH
jgi:hypothetical protein